MPCYLFILPCRYPYYIIAKTKIKRSLIKNLKKINKKLIKALDIIFISRKLRVKPRKINPNKGEIMKTNKKIEVKTDTFKVFVSAKGINVGNFFYPHNVWRNFSINYMRKNMGRIELDMWNKHAPTFERLYKKLALGGK
jgi:hypothetical protein